MVLGVFERRPHVHRNAVSLKCIAKQKLVEERFLTNSLAMAEMTMLLAAIYRKYTTRLHSKQQNASPGITSRFEVFYDETMPNVTVSSSCIV